MKTLIQLHKWENQIQRVELQNQGEVKFRINTFPTPHCAPPSVLYSEALQSLVYFSYITSPASPPCFISELFLLQTPKGSISPVSVHDWRDMKSFQDAELWMPACPRLCLQLVPCPLPDCEQADGGAIIISPIEGRGRGLFQIPSCLSCWNSLTFADVDQQPEGKNSCFKLSHRQGAKKRSVLYGERKERKEKDRVVGNLKGNRKVGKRLRRMDAWAPSCTVLMVKWGSRTSGLHRSCFLINEHKITTTHVEFSKENVDIAQACQSCGWTRIQSSDLESLKGLALYQFFRLTRQCQDSITLCYETCEPKWQPSGRKFEIKDCKFCVRGKIVCSGVQDSNSAALSFVLYDDLLWEGRLMHDYNSPQGEKPV